MCIVIILRTRGCHVRENSHCVSCDMKKCNPITCYMSRPIIIIQHLNEIIKYCNNFHIHIFFSWGDFRAFHKESYSTLFEGPVKTSRFVNSPCFSLSWSAISWHSPHPFISRYFCFAFKSWVAYKTLSYI